MKNSIWLFTFAALLLAIFIPSYSALQDKARKNDQYDQKIAELEQVNEDLKVERVLLEENPSYLEKVAREKMGLVKEGETIIEITPEMTE